MSLSDEDLQKLKFPIGNFKSPDTFTLDDHKTRISSIRELPKALNAVINGLSEAQLDTPYRPGGWTARQLVHHIADSHMNAFTRFKLGLTEENPTIRPYDQNAWCDMEDAKVLSPDASLKIIEGIHSRWTYILENMGEEDFSRLIFHPEMNKSLHLGKMLALYSWHSDHHLAHLTNLVKREGW